MVDTVQTYLLLFMLLFGLFLALVGFGLIRHRWLFSGVTDAKREQLIARLRWAGLLSAACGAFGLLLKLTTDQ